MSLSSPELSSTQKTLNVSSDYSRPLSLLDQPGNKMLMQILLLEDLGKFVMQSIDVVHHPYGEKGISLLLGTGGNPGHGLLGISVKGLTTAGSCSWKTAQLVEQRGWM